MKYRANETEEPRHFASISRRVLVSFYEGASLLPTNAGSLALWSSRPPLCVPGNGNTRVDPVRSHFSDDPIVPTRTQIGQAATAAPERRSQTHSPGSCSVVRSRPFALRCSVLTSIKKMGGFETKTPGIWKGGPPGAYSTSVCVVFVRIACFSDGKSTYRLHSYANAIKCLSVSIGQFILFLVAPLSWGRQIDPALPMSRRFLHSCKFPNTFITRTQQAAACISSNRQKGHRCSCT